MKNASFYYIFLFIVFLISGCSTEPEIVEVTRVVEVEVTRVVEVEVPVTVTPAPVAASGFGSDACEAYTAEVADLALQWSDAFNLATSTARGNLDGPVGELQSIRRDVLALDEPPCGAELGVKQKFTLMADNAIDDLTDFMAGSDPIFALYQINRDVFTDALESLIDQTPLPTRVHYFLGSRTHAAVEYLDENGEWQDLGAGERLDVDEFPAVVSLVVPDGQEIGARIYNPIRSGYQLTCIIMVNGVEVDVQESPDEVECSFTP